MATRMYEVQQKIFSALSNDPTLTTMVTGVFDYIPEETIMPYVTFGQIVSNTDYTKTEEGETITFTLDIWSMAKGRKEAVQILTQVEKIFEADLPLETAFIVQKKATTRHVVEEQYGLYHAFLDVEFKIEWEE